MTAVFTTAAVERIRQMAVDPQEKADLSLLLSVVDAAATPSDLFAGLPGTIRVARRPGADVILVRHGRLTALVTVDPKTPDRMVVASVDHADADPSLADDYARDHSITVAK
ncbi:MAG TPA: hypothetical protein VME47_10125 [Acetobacteraceae bacterium]|nr:hypothetical protein [Acetobacteraceae bacterium]